MCGANHHLQTGRLLGKGSSPRVRGKFDKLNRISVDERIIPACAGQMFWPGGNYEEYEDHPRVCGANEVKRVLRNDGTGSSPRVRGK